MEVRITGTYRIPKKLQLHSQSSERPMHANTVAGGLAMRVRTDDSSCDFRWHIWQMHEQLTSIDHILACQLTFVDTLWSHRKMMLIFWKLIDVFQVGKTEHDWNWDSLHSFFRHVLQSSRINLSNTGFLHRGRCDRVTLQKCYHKLSIWPPLLSKMFHVSPWRSWRSFCSIAFEGFKRLEGNGGPTHLKN